MTINLGTIVFTIIFLFTLKFELFNNLILLVFFIFNLSKIKIKIRSLKPLVLPIFFLLFYFLIFPNINYLKYCIYIFRFLIILYLANKILNLDKLNLRNILEKIFYINVIAIFLCFFFPSINNVFVSIFSYSNSLSEWSISSTDIYNLRVTGFIQGYEFVPFLIVTYLSYEYIILKKKLSKKFILKLIFGALACLFSGRYSVVPLFILFSYIFFNKKNISLKISLFGLSAILFTIFFDKIYLNILNTFYIVYDLILFGVDTDLSNYTRFSENSINIEGQYNLSPLVLLNETLIPFLNWESYLLPSSFKTVDPGPSYMILNLGFILSAFLYVYFFKTIKTYTKYSVPLVVVLIFLSIDFKFRSMYVLLPTVWLVCNHINYVKLLKNENTILH